MQLRLGTANVRTPPRERRRQADGHGRQHGRHDGLAAVVGKFGVERAGRRAGQHGESVHRLRDLRIERRQLRLQAAELRARALHVLLACQADARLLAREVEDLLFGVDFRKCDALDRLRAAQLRIGARDFGFERDERIVAAFDFGLRLRICRFDRAPHAPEQIEFPRCVEAVLIERRRTGRRIETLTNLRAVRAETAEPVVDALRFENALRPSCSRLTLALSCGRPAAAADTLCSRASSIRSTALCSDRLPATARSISESSVASPNCFHQRGSGSDALVTTDGDAACDTRESGGASFVCCTRRASLQVVGRLRIRRLEIGADGACTEREQEHSRAD